MSQKVVTVTRPVVRLPVKIVRLLNGGETAEVEFVAGLIRLPHLDYMCARDPQPPTGKEADKLAKLSLREQMLAGVARNAASLVQFLDADTPLPWQGADGQPLPATAASLEWLYANDPDGADYIAGLWAAVHELHKVGRAKN